MENKRIIIILIVVALILLVPFIAMQFTNEVHWTLPDFIIGGSLLLGTGLLCELAVRKVKKAKYRILICACLFAVLLLIWVELAVGIFGKPFAKS